MYEGWFVCEVGGISLFVPISPDPTHSRAQGNIAYFERLIRSDPEKYMSDSDERGEETAGGENKMVESRERMSEKERYESLCCAP